MFVVDLAVFLLGVGVGAVLILCYQLKSKRDELTKTIDEWKKAIQKQHEEHLKQLDELAAERKAFEQGKR